MFFDKGDFRRSDFTYGVTKDQNVESAIFDVLIVVVVINSKDIFDVLMLTFWSTKKTISTFWNFWPVDVLIVDVPTPCHVNVPKYQSAICCTLKFEEPFLRRIEE